MSAVRMVRGPVTVTVKGTIKPPRGPDGKRSIGAFVVDLEVKIPLEELTDWLAETVQSLELGVVLHNEND